MFQKLRDIPYQNLNFFRWKQIKKARDIFTFCHFLYFQIAIHILSWTATWNHYYFKISRKSVTFILKKRRQVLNGKNIIKGQENKIVIYSDNKYTPDLFLKQLSPAKSCNWKQKNFFLFPENQFYESEQSISRVQLFFTFVSSYLHFTVACSFDLHLFFQQLLIQFYLICFPLSFPCRTNT